MKRHKLTLADEEVYMVQHKENWEYLISAFRMAADDWPAGSTERRAWLNFAESFQAQLESQVGGFDND